MITLSVHIFNTISQKIYDDIIYSISFYSLTCTCGHSGCLIGHGSYQRFMKFDGAKIPLQISRVLCCSCGKTHALLPAFIVPYSQISLCEQVNIISENSPTKANSVMEQNPAIDESNVNSIIRQYNHHWKQRLASEKIPLLPLTLLVKQCFSCFNRQFMQIKNTPNILFLTPT